MAPKKSRFGRRLLAGVLAALLLFSSYVILWRPRPVFGDAPSDGYVRLAGIVHVHTSDSDGAGTPEAVVEAAVRAGLQFLVLTDHNTLAAKPIEGYQGGLLVVVGTEVSTSAGHLLGLGIPDPPYRFSGDILDVLGDIHDMGGIAVAAHPLSPRSDLLWTGWNLPGGWGLEVLSDDSEWRSAGWPRLLRAGALYGLNPRYALLRDLAPPRDVLARWDTILAHRNCPGLAGADAHGRIPVAGKSLPFPSYEALFGLVQNHVVLARPLSGDGPSDVGAVVAALGSGHSYIGVDALAPARDFSFVAERGAERYTMGDSVPTGPGITLRAGGRMPKGTRLRLLKNGVPIGDDEGPLERREVGPGIYRVEARVGNWEVPWIITNAISVVDPRTADDRALASAWPEQGAGEPPRETIDSFGPDSVFAPEHDPTSMMRAPVLEPLAGPNRGPSAHLSCVLKAPSPSQPNTWCALVERKKRDLSFSRGLSFWVRGDGVYRLWVQVRDENLASKEDHLEWWFASVKTSPEWRRVTIPFSRFRSINPVTDGHVDLDKVRGLVFQLDPSCVAPGPERNIWIAELEAY